MLQTKAKVWRCTEYGSHAEKLMKNVNLDEPTSFLDCVYLGGCIQRECKPNEFIIEQCTKMLEQLKSYQGGKNLTQKQSLGLLTWKVMRRRAWKEIASWRTKRQTNCTKFQLVFRAKKKLPRTQKSLMKFLESTRKPKVINTNNSCGN